MAILIKPNENLRLVKPIDDNAFTCDELQGYVEGLFQPMDIGLRDWILFVNEEMMAERNNIYKFNAFATKLAGIPIRGNALLSERKFYK